MPPGCVGTKLAHNPIDVRCTNNERMRSVGTITLYIPTLTAPAPRVSVFREMKKPLLSVPVLADSGCKVTSDKRQVLIENAKPVLVLRGK